MQDSERVGSARFASNGNQHTAPAGKRLENASIVGLEADSAHRSGQAELRQIARAPLQGIDQRASGEHRSDRCKLNPHSGRTKRLFDEGGDVGSLFRNDGQRLLWKAARLQRIQTLLCPRDILENGNGKKTGIRVDHRFLYQLSAIGYQPCASTMPLERERGQLMADS
jgi:hypothetical protein